MKNRYLKSLTARVTILMLSFLCLAGSQGAGAQIPMERRNSSSTSVVSSQKPVMPRMTKSGGNAVSVNGTEYDTWANAVKCARDFVRYRIVESCNGCKDNAI